MNDFQFQNPWFLILLLALPFVHGFILKIQTKGRERLLRFLSEKNLNELERERWVGGTKRKFILFWIGLALFSIALARPQANPIIEDVEGASLDIYVLMDVSKSMDAEDVPPSRLKKAKRSVESLLQFLSGDRLGIIAFAGTSIMISPLTADYDVLKLFLNNIDTSLIQNQGTDISGALGTAFAAMKRGAEKFGGDSRSNVFIVMSDGEDTANPNYEIADQIRENGGLIFSIAFGTEAGASIPVRNVRGELSGYKRDRSGQQVISKVSPESLKKIAEATGGTFYFGTLDEGEITDIVSKMKNLERSNASLRKARIYQEYFIIPLFFGILCIVFSFFSARVLFSLTLWKSAFKRFSALLILFPTLAQGSPVDYLYDAKKRAYIDGENLASEGKPEEAANRLKELLADDPENASIILNLGTYYAKAKKGEEARVQFERILKNEGPLKKEAQFNQAGSYASEGKVPEARAGYAELLSDLEKKKELSNEEQALLEKTRINLAKLASNPPPQNPSPSSGGGGGGGGGGEGENKEPKENPEDSKKEKEQSDSKDSEKKEDSKSPKDGDSEKKQDQKDPQEKEKDDSAPSEQEKEEKNDQGQEEEQKKKSPSMAQGNPNKQKYMKKNNMEEQDAKRILEALKQRESGLQKKFMQFEGKGDEDLRENNGKDW
jgi:Ca-activated chloride channel family protein